MQKLTIAGDNRMKILALTFCKPYGRAYYINMQKSLLEFNVDLQFLEEYGTLIS